jgi:hypothetical protein
LIKAFCNFVFEARSWLEYLFQKKLKLKLKRYCIRFRHLKTNKKSSQGSCGCIHVHEDELVATQMACVRHDGLVYVRMELVPMQTRTYNLWIILHPWCTSIPTLASGRWTRTSGCSVCPQDVHFDNPDIAPMVQQILKLLEK